MQTPSPQSTTPRTFRLLWTTSPRMQHVHIRQRAPASGPGVFWELWFRCCGGEGKDRRGLGLQAAALERGEHVVGSEAAFVCGPDGTFSLPLVSRLALSVTTPPRSYQLRLCLMDFRVSRSSFRILSFTLLFRFLGATRSFILWRHVTPEAHSCPSLRHLLLSKR